MNRLQKLAIASAIVTSASLSMAQDARHIHVNGEHLTSEDITLMDMLFAQTVPDGFYWLNTETGAWGYEGNDQSQGIIAIIAEQSAKQTTTINQSQNGSVVSGNLNGQSCTFASAGGTTVKVCN